MRVRLKWVIPSLCYLALCVAFLSLSSALAASTEVSWLRFIFLTAARPAALLAEGIGAWKWFVAVLALLAAVLGLARLSRQWWPDSELFVLWLVVAAAGWAMSGWLIVLFNWSSTSFQHKRRVMKLMRGHKTHAQRAEVR